MCPGVCGRNFSPRPPPAPKQAIPNVSSSEWFQLKLKQVYFGYSLAAWRLWSCDRHHNYLQIFKYLKKEKTR